MIFHFIILFILVSTTSNIFVLAVLSNDTDQQALLSFKASIKDDPSGALNSWNNSIDLCQWNGVTCSSRRQRVTALNLSLQHLVGTFSPHIGNLSFLRRINLYHNNFHGSIPNEIGRLSRLQYLDLGNNSFEGGFPANLSHCVGIRYISMYNNVLEGELPTAFASWSKLDHFDLQSNHFNGSIPPSIGNISSLLHLFLGFNNLVGAIPKELAHHAKLRFFSLAENRLLGVVPLPLYNISSLIGIALTNTNLEGTLPADLGFTLPNLKLFAAGMNRFSGPFPPSITNASNLIVFDIMENNISGPIPNNLGGLPNIVRLKMGDNPLGDNMRPDDLSFFNSLVNCTHLNILALGNNGLRGNLPNSIVNLSATVEQLYLYGNHIYGSIPHEIRKLVNLRVLSLGDNSLTGTIPHSIGELSKLEGLDLDGNNISGLIPTSITNITQLNALFLERNMLQGSIPTQLFNISTLEKLFLDNNSLRGAIPEEIVFSSQFIYLRLSHNLLTGSLPSQIGRLKQLDELDLSYNKLTGDIPTTLDGCVMLQKLYMQGNLFQGRIPSTFKALKNIEFLDLSDNNISGSIPNFLYGFHQIEYLNLSHNKLEGKVPKEGLFSNVSAFSVVGNLELCGGIPALQLPACPLEISTNKKNTFSLRIILLLVLVPLGILLACLSLMCYRRRKSKKLSEPIPSLKNNLYLKLSYQDLLLATNEFSSNNLLGEGRYGSVYKGFLESVEHVVAVKVLKVEVRGANKSFLAECETLRNIRHRNLIKIITVCSTIDFKGNDFKALVFELMTNGSVDNWLHPSPSFQGNERNLTLLQRLNIIIDVALGVDYLHHHSHASIVHSDIKPSNILLDENFVAHIGDFGLARFFFATSDVNQAQMSSTGVRGTVGYVPPEYGMGGEISTQGDIYSYGILLLEIFSGKRPTESSMLVEGVSSLHDYVKQAIPQRVMDITDPRIVLNQEEHSLTGNQSFIRASMEECLASIFEVGILCSEETPRKRIDISVAIKKLHMARDKLLQSTQYHA